MTAEQALVFLTNPQANFGCTGCGRCCRGWAIGLTRADAARFADPAAEWAGRGKGRPLTVLDDTAHVALVNTNATADDACPMLDSDDLCHITRTHGPEATPGICQIFPYRYTRTPDGIAVSLSYGCEAVIDNVGTPMRDQLPAIAHAYTLTLPYVAEDMVADNAVDAARRYPVAARARLTWDGYRAFEPLCLGWLAAEAPIAERLNSLLAAVYDLDAWAGEQTLGPADVAAWHTNSPVPQLAEDAATQLHAVTLLAPLAFLFGEDDANAAMTALVVGAGTLRVVFGPRPIAVDVAAQADVVLQSDARRFLDDLLARYATDFVRAKNMCLQPSALAALYTLHVYAALLDWYARALASCTGRTAATITDVREAAIALERYGETLLRYAAASAAQE